MSNKKSSATSKTTSFLLSSISHELIQPLTVIQAEIDLMALQGNPPSAATLARLNNAVALILEQARRCQEASLLETEAGGSGIAKLTLLAS